MSIPKMHIPVVLWATLGGCLAVTLPIAIWRVSQTPKFTGQAVVSFDCGGKPPPQRQVVTELYCANLTVQPLPAKK
jgi:hypothetical protein